MVIEHNKSIVQTAKQLKVKLSTAKLILKKFKETGMFFDKKMPDYCRRKKKEP
jgi:transposase